MGILVRKDKAEQILERLYKLKETMKVDDQQLSLGLGDMRPRAEDSRKGSR
jgi:hypothetical protein